MTSTLEEYKKTWIIRVLSFVISFLIAGLAIGFGICILVIVEILPPILEENFDIQFDPKATIGLVNYTWIMILLGVIMFFLGCVEAYRAYNTMKPKVIVETKMEGKFFCRYCGKENKPDAVYCEGCGKKL